MGTPSHLSGMWRDAFPAYLTSPSLSQSGNFQFSILQFAPLEVRQSRPERIPQMAVQAPNHTF